MQERCKVIMYAGYEKGSNKNLRNVWKYILSHHRILSLLRITDTFARKTSARGDSSCRLDARTHSARCCWQTIQVQDMPSNVNNHKILMLLNKNIFSLAVPRSSSRSAVVELITRLELFVTVAFVGDNLEEVVDFMDRWEGPPWLCR